MAHYKSYLVYEAYRVLEGQFPANIVVYTYKGFGFTKKAFEKIGIERFNAREKQLIESFKWLSN
jgi:hypothetical protein